MHRHYQVVFDLSPLPLVYDISSPYKGTDIQILVQLTRGWLLQCLERVIKYFCAYFSQNSSKHVSWQKEVWPHEFHTEVTRRYLTLTNRKLRYAFKLPILGTPLWSLHISPFITSFYVIG